MKVSFRVHKCAILLMSYCKTKSPKKPLIFMNGVMLMIGKCDISIPQGDQVQSFANNLHDNI